MADRKTRAERKRHAKIKLKRIKEQKKALRTIEDRLKAAMRLKNLSAARGMMNGSSNSKGVAIEAQGLSNNILPLNTAESTPEYITTEQLDQEVNTKQFSTVKKEHEKLQKSAADLSSQAKMINEVMNVLVKEDGLHDYKAAIEKLNDYRFSNRERPAMLTKHFKSLEKYIKLAINKNAEQIAGDSEALKADREQLKQCKKDLDKKRTAYERLKKKYDGSKDSQKPKIIRALQQAREDVVNADEVYHDQFAKVIAAETAIEAKFKKCGINHKSEPTALGQNKQVDRKLLKLWQAHIKNQSHQKMYIRPEVVRFLEQQSKMAYDLMTNPKLAKEMEVNHFGDVNQMLELTRLYQALQEPNADKLSIYKNMLKVNDRRYPPQQDNSRNTYAPRRRAANENIGHVDIDKITPQQITVTNMLANIEGYNTRMQQFSDTEKPHDALDRFTVSDERFFLETSEQKIKNAERRSLQLLRQEMSEIKEEIERRNDKLSHTEEKYTQGANFSEIKDRAKLSFAAKVMSRVKKVEKDIGKLQDLMTRYGNILDNAQDTITEEAILRTEAELLTTLRTSLEDQISLYANIYHKCAEMLTHGDLSKSDQAVYAKLERSLQVLHQAIRQDAGRYQEFSGSENLQDLDMDDLHSQWLAFIEKSEKPDVKPAQAANQTMDYRSESGFKNSQR